jgi:hypothetical protein
VEDWNNLPDDTKSAGKLSIFKTECYKNVTGGCVAGLEEKLQVIYVRMSPPPTSAVQFKNIKLRSLPPDN